MMRNVSLDNFPSHSVSDCPHEISIMPQLPRPQSPLQSRELAKQTHRTLALDDSYNLAYRLGRRKRYQNMHMFLHNFQLDDLKSIVLTYLPNQLFRSFPNLLPLKDIFPVLWTPNQVVTGVVDRMTRPLYAHPLYIAQFRARAYADKGDFPVPLIIPSERHAFIPRGKPRGILQRFC